MTAQADRLQQLQQALADDAAVSEIELGCDRQPREGGWWYQLESALEEDKADIARAIEYLALRGLLIHHPNNSRLIDLRRSHPGATS